MTLFPARPALGLLSLAPLSLALLVGGATAAHSQQFASSVTSYSDLSTNPAYSNPAAALGQPTTLATAGGQTYHDSMVYSAYGTNPDGSSTLVQLNPNGQGSLIVAFSDPITHSASHWYGDDFIVYNNNFFIGSSSSGITPTTDMNGVTLTGGLFGTLPTVSVSNDGINFVTLKSPDPVFYPENPYQWVGISAQNPSGWNDASLQDFSKPVDPALTASAFAGQTVAYAADTLYGGSAGGTAFSLAGTPFADTGIKYIEFTGTGTIDGVSRVADAPAAVPEASTLLSFGVLCGLGAAFAVRRSRKPASV